MHIFYIVLIFVLTCISFGLVTDSYAQKVSKIQHVSDKSFVTTEDHNSINFTANIGGKSVVISLPISKLLFKPVLNASGSVNTHSASIIFKQKPELSNMYHEIGWYHMSQKAVFVYPIFTQAAYDKNGFYDYYAKTCDTKCLTVPIPNKISSHYTSSARGATALTLLYYPHITDIDIDKNPDILKKYDKVILLHNEYVTKREFDAITKHPNVVYLYPNALYAQVNVDYAKNTITLVKGHGYQNVNNAFGWKYDASKSEYDFDCNNWKFNKIPNGKALSCYPEYRLLTDKDLLNAIKN